jgi:viologen exporter family transport system permease protein
VTAAAAPAIASVGPVRGYVDYYTTAMRIGISTQFQYRVANYFFLIAHVAEPVIYLVVWSTVAVQQGGEVGGFTPNEFAAYYIVWTLVRTMNITSVGIWEGHIREGDLSRMLLHPIHPMHWDLGYFAGWKIVNIVLWLPVAIALSLLFRPTFNIEPIDVAVFGVAIWGAFLVRSLLYSNLGLVAFWTTRLSPILQVVMTLELLFSGRLVPLSLMPEWAQHVADVLPFKWTFGYPIEALIGQLPTSELLGGLAMQALWIAISIVGIRLLWPVAVRRYSAVGG